MRCIRKLGSAERFRSGSAVGNDRLDRRELAILSLSLSIGQMSPAMSEVGFIKWLGDALKTPQSGALLNQELAGHSSLPECLGCVGRL